MLIIISPSKTMEPYDGVYTLPLTKHRFIDQTKVLVTILQKKTKKELGNFMSLSDKLTDQNFERYQQFYKGVNASIASPAILTFKGEVYNGLKADKMSEENLIYSNKHLRILSGLYGSLRPSDKIVPYRLEMGSRLHTDKGSNLYHYWSDTITASINNDISKSGSPYLANLASDEYFKVLNTKDLRANVIHFDFFEMRNGKKTFISFSAKKARGLMASYIISNKIKDISQLMAFNTEGFLYDTEASKPNNLVFVKG